MNLRKLDSTTVGVSFDETTRLADVDALLEVFNGGKAAGFKAESLAQQQQGMAAVGNKLEGFERSSKFMQQPIFNSYHK
jgi:glycine dehydrogenase